MGRQQRRAQLVAGGPVDFRGGELQRGAVAGELEAELPAGFQRAGKRPCAAGAGQLGRGVPGVPDAALVERVEVVVGEAVLLLEMLGDDFGHGQSAGGLALAVSPCGFACGFAVPASLSVCLRAWAAARLGGFAPPAFCSSSSSSVDAGQPDQDVVAFAVAAIAQRHPPALGEDSQDVLQSVGAGDRPPAEADDLVVVAESAAVGVGGFEDFVDHDVAVVVPVHGGAEGGVVHHPAAMEDAEEVLDLVDRDGVGDADVHPAALLERAAAVDAHQASLGVEQRAARVARVDRGVGLDAVGVFQQRAGRGLVAVHAGDDPVGDGGLEVGGQQEGVAHGEDPVAHAEPVAVGQLGGGEIVAAEEFDQGHVAGGVQSDQHGVVDLAVGHAALHVVAAGERDVEVGQGIAVGGDDHAGAAPLAAGHKDGQHAVLGLPHGGDPLGLGLQDRGGRLGQGRQRRGQRERQGNDAANAPRLRTSVSWAGLRPATKPQALSPTTIVVGNLI